MRTMVALLFLVLHQSALALEGWGEEERGRLSWAQWVDRCAQARVLYLGEEHDGAVDHELQFQTLQALAQRRAVTVVAEMFQLPSREVLCEYQAGRLDDAELRAQSEWDKRWGHPWELYLPIWQVSQRYGVGLRPLRNSTESGKNLSKLGVQGFTLEERRGLAPEPYQFGPQPESLRKVFEAHAGPVSQEAFDRFLKAQTLWEEFMAAQIRSALREEQGMVVVLVGKGHLLHGLGLPRRVQNDWPHPLRQSVVVVNPDSRERPRCDLWWKTEKNSN
jgi:uncharacterized iron-regulated protein